MRSNISLFVLVTAMLISITACKRDIPPPQAEMDAIVNLWIRDSHNNNLLDSNTVNYYKASEIRIFYVVRGVNTEVFNPAMDAPRNFLVFKNEGNGEYFMRLFPYVGDDNAYTEDPGKEITKTYIQWRANIVDTLDCEVTRTRSSGSVTKIMYNGVLKYGADTNRSVNWGNGIFSNLIEVTK